MNTNKSIHINGKLITITSPLVMGIVNITEDSFYAGSRVSEENLLSSVEKMIEEGCDMIDLGAQSTRPHAVHWGVEHEIKKLLPCLQLVKKRFPIPVSIDTFHAEVAHACLLEGADIINDVTGGQYDPNMFDVLEGKKIPFVCNHLKGDLQNMQSKENTTYENLEKEMITFFIQKKKQCFEKKIHDIILDIGFGFSKTLDDNYRLIALLPVLNKLFSEPIMVGFSRKSSIYKLLNTDPEKALHGTDALHAVSILNGANILRVHDVKACKDVIKIIQHYKQVTT